MLIFWRSRPLSRVECGLMRQLRWQIHEKVSVFFDQLLISFWPPKCLSLINSFFCLSINVQYIWNRGIIAIREYCNTFFLFFIFIFALFFSVCSQERQFWDVLNAIFVVSVLPRNRTSPLRSPVHRSLIVVTIEKATGSILYVSPYLEHITRHAWVRHVFSKLLAYVIAYTQRQSLCFIDCRHMWVSVLIKTVFRKAAL